MADETYLSVLQQGVEAWNKWRSERYRYHPDLSGADLGGADLSDADLSKANLSRACLRKANLSNAYLREANLTEAQLNQAILSAALLDGANFERATMASTILGAVDLSSCIGLDSVTHTGPSTLGVNSVILSKGRIPEAFLRGVGLPGL
jgi:hypothetical protein